MKQAGNSNRKNFRWYMRYLHNKIGFVIVGLVIMYGLSGLLQTYRDTDLLKHEVVHEQQLAPHLTESQLAPNLRIRDFKVIKTEGNILYFGSGTYNAETGMAKFTTKEWYSWLVPFTELHKTSSRSVAHYFTTLFGIALLFMSVSAFWMFKPGTKLFSSGVYLTVAGIIAAIIMLLIQ
ncbi:MAG: hypothetical protein JST75_01715 [Bacteroidetes bacterium]|nr:hypothetical protein [Bacteroidota bacterium]